MVAEPAVIAEEIGEQYMDYPVQPDDPDERQIVADSFEVTGNKNLELFENIPIEVIFQEEDPYDDYDEMQQDVAENGILRIFSGGDPHPIWDWDTELKGRAVHDWFGHLEYPTGFDVVGEYRNWMHNREHYPVWCERVLFTEVIGQLGAAYFLADGFADDRFEQKVFRSPAEWIDRLDRSVREHGYVSNP